METELVRGEIKAIDPELLEAESREELASQAARLLGYQKLSAQINWKNRKLQSITSAVEQAKKAFAAIGLEPLTDESIQAYKAEKVQIQMRRYAIRNFCNSDNGITAMGYCGIGGVLGKFGFGLAIMLTESFHLWRLNHFLTNNTHSAFWALLCVTSFLMWACDSVRQSSYETDGVHFQLVTA